MIKMIDEQNYGLTKEVKKEELNEHLRWRCEDYQKRNKDKDIVIDKFGNINCTDCEGCCDCDDCEECTGCANCELCINCSYISCQTGGFYEEGEI